MSADNWGECPRCKAIATVAHAKRRQVALDAYGKVSSDEYARLCTEAAKLIKANDTFREDYEIGLHKDGTFKVNYGGGCVHCGLSFSYKHEERVKI